MLIPNNAFIVTSNEQIQLFTYISPFNFCCTSDGDLGPISTYYSWSLNKYYYVNFKQCIYYYFKRTDTPIQKLHQLIVWKGVTRVATPWPASDPAMTPRGEEAAARAK